MTRTVATTILTAFLLCGCGTTPGTDRETHLPYVRVEMVTPDGIRTIGDLYNAGPGTPGVVLVHMLASNRKAWGDFPVRLKKRGITVLAIDLRGHGESTRTRGNKQISFQDFSSTGTNNQWNKAIADVGTAVRRLRKSNVPPR